MWKTISLTPEAKEALVALLGRSKVISRTSVDGTSMDIPLHVWNQLDVRRRRGESICDVIIRLATPKQEEPDERL